MPGEKDKEATKKEFRESLDRKGIFQKLKDAIKKGLGIVKDVVVRGVGYVGDTVTAVGVRVFAGQKGFNNWLENKNAEVDRAEMREANGKMVGSKVVVKDGKFHLEGTIEKVTQTKEGESYHIKLCNGKELDLSKDEFVSRESFEDTNRKVPNEYKIPLIDEDAWKKIQEAEKAKDSEPAVDKNDTPEKEPTAPSEAQFEEGQKLYSAITFGEGTGKAYAGVSELTISDVKSKEGKTFYEISSPDGKTQSVSEEQLVNTLKNDDVFTKEDFKQKFGKTSMRVYTAEHPKGVPAKDMFAPTKEDLDKIEEPFKENQTEEPKVQEAENDEQDKAPNNDTQELPENDKDTTEEKASTDMPQVEDKPFDKDENEQFPDDVEQEEMPKETYFDDPENVITTTEEDYEPFENEQEDYNMIYNNKISKGMNIPNKTEDLQVGDHILYSYKGKHQEAIVTAINKKSVEIELNDGRGYTVKKADMDKTMFGFDDIKADKVMTQCVKDEKNTKFSSDFRETFKDMEAGKYISSMLSENDRLDELDDLDGVDYNNKETEFESLEDQMSDARNESSGQTQPRPAKSEHSQDIPAFEEI
jgi:preprotein translocase subunit YajC